jgi:hypothetical protein
MRLWMVLILLAFCSSVPALQSPTKERIYLELGNARVTENGETVIEVDAKCGPGEIVAFHLPEKGWFVVSSVKPSGGYGLRKIGKLAGNRITFEVHDRRYEIISDKPMSPQTTSLDLWVINITGSTGTKADADSKLLICATDFKSWLKTTLFRDEKK